MTTKEVYGNAVERHAQFNITWDMTSGKPPHKGQTIKNIFGTYEVIARKGSTVTIKAIS